VAKTVKIENLAKYQIHISSTWKKIFNTWPDVEWQRWVNLNIGPDIKGLFFDIEENY
jgi:hypothetical protein